MELHHEPLPHNAHRPRWFNERHATVVVQLFDERGDRKVLLGESHQPIEQGQRIELFRLL